jgi:acetyl esterase/lipase
VYGIARSNGENELRVISTTGGAATIAPFGEGPVFSADSKWLAYAIGLPEAEEEKLQKQKKPVRKKLGLLELGTGNTQTLEAVESFAFNAAGTHLAIRHYPPEPEPKDESSTAPAATTADDEPPRRAMLLVRDLVRGMTITFGNVTEYSWQNAGRFLALIVAPAPGAAHAVQLLNPEAGTIRTLDSGTSRYRGLAWRKDANDLAAFRAKGDDRRDGPTEVLLAWRSLGSDERSHVLDPTAAGSLSPTERIAGWTTPTWTDDGRVVFVGVADWDEALPRKDPKAKEEEEPATVSVWHPLDADVIPKQQVNARQDRRRTLLHAWHLESSRLVPLARTISEQVRPLRNQGAALLIDRTPHLMARSIGRLSADVYLVDLDTGERRLVRERVNDQYLRVSPGGRYVLFFEADHYWTYDVRTGVSTNVTTTVPTSFTNRQSDATVAQKPPHGVADFTRDDAAVLLYDTFDIWEVRTDGSRATRLTSGTADQIEHRYWRLDAEEEGIDRGAPLYLEVFGDKSKRHGYAVLRPGTDGPERLVWLDKRVGGLARAKHADTFAYVAEAFDDSSDYFVGDAALATAARLTDTNAFQSEYAWGHTELIDYKTDRGERLQGVIAYPAGYQPGRRYPMIVYMYEKLSDDLHGYSPLSERAYYNVSVFTTLGYIVLRPDIVFRPREPGLSVVECVVPAVKKAIQMGVADPSRVGVMGHSWGGFDASFLATHTDLFAAAVAGAPITNLVSNYGNHHWRQGIAETDHIETGQQRMEVPLWEDLPAYIRNSAVFNAHRMKTPLLVMFGEEDGTVFWHQGVELYNIARRAGRPVTMLTYAGEDHGLRKKANQIDYQIRIAEWFGHYLQEQPAPAWIERGVTHLERERELRRRAAAPKKVTTDP